MSETDMTDYAELREEKAATPHNELIAQLLDSRVPKSEREHAAAREIERLRAQVEGWKGLAEALRGWWKAHRPVGWTEDQHRSCPHVNLATDAEKALATALLRYQEE